ncbi:unnamed protein product [Adineta ricciae]|uniref:Uncharacterized protein n=1 Tax=Adineta ricciae TaxID=249248 RepID=A0A814VLC8_ADIRI|nr:unnamed protein product [Adineta ricciae]CAF1214456.1 unnamed protein product [Adineta ricciae]
MKYLLLLMKLFIVVGRYNHRIMKWLSNASVCICVAGNCDLGRNEPCLMSSTDIVVDENGFMYISESESTQITRWTPNSTASKCVVGCTKSRGNASNQLSGPHSLTFDKYGLLYVVDYENHRKQNFQILNNSETSTTTGSMSASQESKSDKKLNRKRAQLPKTLASLIHRSSVFVTPIPSTPPFFCPAKSMQQFNEHWHQL